VLFVDRAGLVLLLFWNVTGLLVIVLVHIAMYLKPSSFRVGVSS